MKKTFLGQALIEAAKDAIEYHKNQPDPLNAMCPQCFYPAWDCQCEYVEYIKEDQEETEEQDLSEL